jgi:protein ImuA
LPFTAYRSLSTIISMAPALDLIMQNPAVWRGRDCARVTLPSVPTGFAELDAWLPGGGWPAGAITEIHVDRTGIGELQLIMPAAARLTRSGRWLALIAPPYVPYAPALMGHGVKLSRLMLVRTTSAEDSLWACEQALRSQTCGAALAWLDRIHERALRRLQLAAESGNSSLLLFRPARAAPSSPAALRLHISKSEGCTLVRILKRRGGEVPMPIALDLHPRTTTRNKPMLVPISDRSRLPELQAVSGER